MRVEGGPFWTIVTGGHAQAIITTNIFIIAAITGTDPSYIDLGRRLWTPVRTMPAARSKVNGVRFRCLAAGFLTLGPMRSRSCYEAEYDTKAY